MLFSSKKVFLSFRFFPNLTFIPTTARKVIVFVMNLFNSRLNSLATLEFVSIVALNDNACFDLRFREVRSFGGWNPQNQRDFVRFRPYRKD